MIYFWASLWGKPYFKAFLIISLIVVLLLVGRMTPMGDWFGLENIAEAVRNGGYWGFFIFVLLCTMGSFIQIPALLFVLAAILIYGHLEGTIYGFTGIVIGMILHFYAIRVLGGKIIRDFKNPTVRRLLSHLDERPLLTVIFLRLILWAAPVLNYVLAMTNLKPSHYIIGSIAGIIPPVVAFSAAVYYFKELILPLFGN